MNIMVKYVSSHLQGGCQVGRWLVITIAAFLGIMVFWETTWGDQQVKMPVDPKFGGFVQLS
jgi:hypothetical protein